MNTTINEIEYIKDILSRLPAFAVQEVRDFAAYLADRESRRNALVKRALKAEQESETVECRSAEEFIQAIEKANADNDD